MIYYRNLSNCWETLPCGDEGNQQRSYTFNNCEKQITKYKGGDCIKDIKGYEGYYKITKDGNIFSVRSNRFLKLNYKKNGYVYIELNVNGIAKTHRVHRLVANAYIPNPDNKPFINHIDGVKSNNCVENLEWVTGTENNLHAIENKLVIPKSNTYEVINPDDGTRKICHGFIEVEKYTDLKSSQICNLLNKNKPSRKGYYIRSVERSTTSA